MIDTKTTTVLAAFEQLLEEMESEIEFATKDGAAAFARRDFARVDAMRTRAEQLTAVRDNVAALRSEWKQLVPPSVVEDSLDVPAAADERRNLGRLQRGLRTPEEAFRRPILQALVELRGGTKMADVLTRVEQLMRGTLRKVDYEPLASTPDEPRWRNTAQWARNAMVKEGLLRSNSPWGVWEITDAGRRFLDEGKS